MSTHAFPVRGKMCPKKDTRLPQWAFNDRRVDHATHHECDNVRPFLIGAPSLHCLLVRTLHAPADTKSDDLREVAVFKDLRDYLRSLESKGWLKRIEKEIHRGDEIFCILWKLASMGRNDPALVFERVRGSSLPIVANIFGSDLKRWSFALGAEETMQVKELRDLVVKRLDTKEDWKKPVEVSPSDAPVKEVIKKGGSIDLYEFPILQWHPNDNGRYITYGLAITKDPEYGLNMGIYRMMLLDKDKTTIMCSPFQHIGIHLNRAKKAGKKFIECAVAIGASPNVVIAGFTKMDIRENELEFASAINGGNPVEIVKGETVDLEIPARSEIVLEGRIMVSEYAPEGTFGEYMGYHEEQMTYPVFRISCITHRRDPLYLTTIVSHHRADGEGLFRSVVQNAHFYRELRKARIPGFVDCWLPLYGHGFVGIVAVDKKYSGWGRPLLYRILSIPFVTATLNSVILVDADIDPSNMDEVIWALGTRTDPERDVVITKPIAMYGLNPAASIRTQAADKTTEISLISRMLIDATLKTAEDGMQRIPPVPVRPPKDTMEIVESRWHEYGL